MNQWERIAYWIITGTFVGFGLVGAASIGLPFLLIGAIMTLFGLLRLGPKGVWAAILSFGIVPIVVILYGYFRNERCSAGIGYMLPPNSSVDTLGTECSYFPGNYLSSVVFFGIFVLTGTILGVEEYLKRSSFQHK